uniref:Uncharacterized protein n=1 Tax=Solanum tuberosum TaxID=4113 RepID=M1DEM6_SOLTU
MGIIGPYRRDSANVMGGGGDFNTIMNEEEKLGGLPVLAKETQDFNHCINWGIRLNRYRPCELNMEYGVTHTEKGCSTCLSVLSPEGEGQVCDENEQSVRCRAVPRSSTISPNDSKREEAEG